MKILPSTIQAIETALTESIGRSVEALWFDVQDDSEFFLIVAEMAPKMSDEEAANILQKIRSIVGPLVPPREKNYSWMAVLKVNGKVRDVCQSDMLMSE